MINAVAHYTTLSTDALCARVAALLEARMAAPDARAGEALREIAPEVRRRMSTGTARDHVLLAGVANLLAIALTGRQIPWNERYSGFERAMALWLAGDTTVTPEDLMELLQPLLALNPLKVADRYRRWAATLHSRWVALYAPTDAVAPGDPLTRRRLSLLINTDLTAYLGSDQPLVKHRWATLCT